MASISEGGGRHGEPAARVLVVDDEEPITDLVATALRYEGFDVATAEAGRDALTRIRTYRPDVVVLDVMLPDIDGFEVIRRMTAEGLRVPVLFLTARDTTEDRVHGLTLGADDYICKPFSLAELVARVRVALRRGQRLGEGDDLRFANLEMDTETMEVRRGDRIIDLTPTEFKLLRYLLLNARRVLSKEQIIDHVWNYDFNGDARIVETYVSYLRRKVDAGESPLIHTVRGFGYSLRLARE
ncbi:MAG: response regulator transcription factor [Dehalococcoidia bacterium]|nr:response regulator transcription factor [Dehalococcoidia bacterium]